MIKVRIYVVVVFDKESLSADGKPIALGAAPLVQLSNTSLGWLIIKNSKATRSHYMVIHTKLYVTVGIIVYLTILLLPRRIIYNTAW